MPEEPEKVLIIGSGAVGMPVARMAREAGYEVTVLTMDKHVAYSHCGLPFVLEGVISSWDTLILRSPEYYDKLGIKIYLETTATAIDLEEQVVESTAGSMEYDILVIATGSTAFVPSIPGADLEGVHTLKFIEDGKAIEERMRDAEHAVVVGAGAIGLETAVAFQHQGIDTTVVELLPHVLPQIVDPDMAMLVQERLEETGIRVLTDHTLDAIRGDTDVEYVMVDGETLPADLVLMATGVRPNTKIAEEAGIDVGGLGGIKTDDQLHALREGVPLENVYAGGDCVEVIDAVTGEPTLSPLGSTARRQADVIGRNIMGRESYFPPTLSPTVTVVAGLTAGSVGLTSHSAREAGIEVTVGKARNSTKARYYPSGKPIDVKLLFGDDRLVGAQVISEDGVKERVDALSFAIQSEMTIQDLVHSETSYAPPVSMLLDAFTLAAKDAAKKKGIY